MKRTLCLLFTGLFLYNYSLAQQDFTLYNMNFVQQRNQLNPAFIPDGGKIFLGIPAVSSIYINAGNSGFKYSDAIKHREDDSLYLDFANVINKLRKNNYVHMNFRIDLLSFGIKVEKNYFTFNITERANVRFRYTKNFMEFAWRGNGAFLDKEVSFNFGLDLSHYREYAIGATRQITDKLSLGLKLKYLYGMENFNAKKTNISLLTASDDFSITAKGNIELNSSGLGPDETSFSFGNYAFKRKNNGYGADLGMEYKATEKITLSASLLDLGFIRWNYNVNNYVSHDQNAKFTYNGFELNQFINNDSASTKEIGKILGDSLSEIFKVDTLHRSYKTSLSTQVYFGANFKTSDNNNIGVILYGQFFDKRLRPGMAVSFNHHVGEWLNLSASYSISNRSYTNVGLGAAIAGGPFQFYIAMDNVIGTIFPYQTKGTQLHFGINFIFGKNQPAASAANQASAPPTPASTPASTGTK